MRTHSLSLALMLTCAPAMAQHLVAYDPMPAGTGMMSEAQLPSVMTAGPIPPMPMYPIAPALPFVAAMVPAGDATFNGLTNQIWYSNGMILASMPSPSFSFAAPALPPFPISAAVMGLLGGPVTGIAIDPVAAVMYLCSPAGIVVGVTPIPGTPIVVPAFALAFATGAITGLDYDSISGSLFAVDAGGFVYNFAVGGAPLAPPIGPAAVAAIPGDVAIDKTGMVNPAGLRPIYVNGGGFAVDATVAAAMPIPMATAAPTGLAFLPRPAANSATSCPCGGVLPSWGAVAPMASGQGAFGLKIGGLAPFTPVLMAFDAGYNAALPIINGTGCPLGIFPGSTSISTFFALTGLAGDATWSLPLTFLPPGIGPVYAQTFWACSADPAGFALTNTKQIVVTGH